MVAKIELSENRYYCLSQNLKKKKKYWRSKICCFLENLSINYFMFFALHSADKFSNEQQILELKYWFLFLFFFAIRTFWHLQEKKVKFDIWDEAVYTGAFVTSLYYNQCPLFWKDFSSQFIELWNNKNPTSTISPTV